MAASGWYPDPENRENTERYWDGTTWLDTREAAEPLPKGWYPDPEFRPNMERYWDGEQWWDTRTNPDSIPPSARPESKPAGPRLLAQPEEGPATFSQALTYYVLFCLLAGAIVMFLVRDRTIESKPRWTEQECVQAVLDELVAVRSEVEFPTMTDWSVDRQLNPLLDAALTSEERCGPGSRTIRGFDWSSVQEDMDALRGHLRWDRDRPRIEDLTPLSEIEAHLD